MVNLWVTKSSFVSKSLSQPGLFAVSGYMSTFRGQLLQSLLRRLIYWPYLLMPRDLLNVFNSFSSFHPYQLLDQLFQVYLCGTSNSCCSHSPWQICLFPALSFIIISFALLLNMSLGTLMLPYLLLLRSVPSFVELTGSFHHAFIGSLLINYRDLSKLFERPVNV